MVIPAKAGTHPDPAEPPIKATKPEPATNEPIIPAKAGIQNGRAGDAAIQPQPTIPANPEIAPKLALFLERAKDDPEHPSSPAAHPLPNRRRQGPAVGPSWKKTVSTSSIPSSRVKRQTPMYPRRRSPFSSQSRVLATPS